ncbi:hypothetical protein KF728_08240 [Candidatus Obscuribacterales bacterium]|nr:hypothetical protein [Candidatus Obscuribacterales bacterium]
MKYGVCMKKQLRSGLTGITLPIVALLVLTTNQFAGAADGNEWTVILKAQQLKRAFQYKGSQLNKVVKVDVVYRPSLSDNEPKEYESLWCNDGKPIGMQRKGLLGLERGKLLHINVEQKANTEEENRAIAFALMHFSLQAYHRFCPIVTISVPDQTFDDICDALRRRGCEDYAQEVETGHGGSVMFNMQSFPSRNARRLYFRNPNGSDD